MCVCAHLPVGCCIITDRAEIHSRRFSFQDVSSDICVHPPWCLYWKTSKNTRIVASSPDFHTHTQLCVFQLSSRHPVFFFFLAPDPSHGFLPDHMFESSCMSMCVTASIFRPIIRRFFIFFSVLCWVATLAANAVMERKRSELFGEIQLSCLLDTSSTFTLSFSFFFLSASHEMPLKMSYISKSPRSHLILHQKLVDFQLNTTQQNKAWRAPDNICPSFER